MPAGRPTKLTPALQAAIIKLLRAGNYVETAALACGVTKQTLYNWQLRGEDEQGPYRDFLDAVKEAQALAEVDLLKEVSEGGLGWQSRAWVLERTRRQRYALATRAELEAKVEHTGKGGQPLSALTDAQLTQIIDAAREEAPAGGDDSED